MEVIDNESVRAVAVPECWTCRRHGQVMHSGLRDRTSGAPGTWDLRQCPGCGLVWLDPQPLPEELPKLYEGACNTHVTAAPAPEAGVQDGLRRAILARTHGYPAPALDNRGTRAARLLARVGPLREVAAASVRWLPTSRRGRLLDVGCGNGAFLVRMRELGWEVAGVEPDPVAGQHARRALGTSVVVGTVGDAGFADASFDVVTLSHVVEHVADPTETLRSCGRLLRPGGWLVVATPNTRALGRRLFGPSWLGWSPPQHVVLFTPALLRRASEAAGLRVLSLRTSASSALLTWNASRCLGRHGALASEDMRSLSWRLTAGGVLFWAVEHALATMGPWGEEIVLVATREP